MKLVQEFVTNSENRLLVVEQQNFDWRSEWKYPEFRNDEDREVGMKKLLAQSLRD